MQRKHLMLAAGLLLAATGTAAAAPAVVTNDLNLRSGPSTGYRVVNVMPAGATVDVIDCSGNWCRVAWGGTEGYASLNYLGLGEAAYAQAPPVIGLGFGWGDGWRRGLFGSPYYRGWRVGPSYRGWRYRR
jgi:uncharacterized protein YgiM (DUF1202 family)